MAETSPDVVTTPDPSFASNENGREATSLESFPPSLISEVQLKQITEALRKLRGADSCVNVQVSIFFIYPTKERVVTTFLPGGLPALFQAPASTERVYLTGMDSFDGHPRVSLNEEVL